MTKQTAAVLEDVRLDDIVGIPEPKDLRMDADEFGALCTSIDQDGLINPITLRRLPDPIDGKRHKLMAGRHRAAAHVFLKRETVRSLVHDQDLADDKEAVMTAVENMHRKGLRPHEEAEAYQAALDAGLTQSQLAERIAVSQPTISKRLALLKIPRCLAELAGDEFPVEEAPWLAPLKGHDELAQQVAQVIKSGDAHNYNGLNLRYATRMALTSTKKGHATLAMPFCRSWIRSNCNGLNEYDWQLADKILASKVYQKDVEPLVTLEWAKTGRDGDMRFATDVKAVKEAIERAKQRIQKATKDQNGSAGKEDKKLSQAELQERRTRRIENKTRKMQLDAMVAHVTKQEYDDELVKHAYRRLLSAVGQVASRKVDQEALAAILGEYTPKQNTSSYFSGHPLSRGRPELVDALWDKDRKTLDRYIAAVVHLDAAGYDHLVTNDKVCKFTTGKTVKAIKGAAERAVDGPKKAPAKKPAAKKAGKKNGAKKATPKKPAAKKPAGSTNGVTRAKAKLAEATVRPGAPVGKECPECKGIVSKKGRGKEAMIDCFCTPAGGVPA